MNLLLDTCTFIWLCSAPLSLSSKAAVLIDDRANELCLSLASCWEIGLKYRSGKIQLPNPPHPWMAGRIGYWNLKTIEIDLASICQSVDLPDLHKDPFDRLLIAQAQTRSLTILTPDPWIQKYAVATLW